MSIPKWLQETAQYGYSSLAGGVQAAGAGVGYVTGLVGNFRIFGNTTQGDAEQKYDERHYFLVTDPRSQDGYSIVVNRVLPDGVPPINKLAKRRILHLPNEESELMLRKLLVDQAKTAELAKLQEGKTLADRARELADAIDALDERVFGGVLLIGGLVAIFNPVAGAAIAAKSLLPSLGVLASKYGLRIAEDKLNDVDMQRRAKQAEKEVATQFRQAGTTVVVNQMLFILQTAVDTAEDEYDPMLAFDDLRNSEQTEETVRWQRLAAAAILGVYEEVLVKGGAQANASLGPEDVRFLRLIKEVWG